jgi:peptidoglycan/LPS O-acetylase OafA/YrhL
MTSQSRLHALDALRAGALLLGVFGHAAISFFPQPAWVADDSDSSPMLQVAFFTQHIFRMSLFFAIAGFFARLLLERRGFKGFAANRLKRIALPFLVFWPSMLAALVGVAVWAASYAGTGPFGPQSSLAPVVSDGQRLARALWQAMPLGHTWFLYVLLWLYAGALAVVGVVRVLDRHGRLATAVDRLFGALASAHVLPVVLALPLAGVFYFGRHWTATGGIQTPDTGLVPNASALVGFGTAFVFGWYLRRQPAPLDVWQRYWLLYWVATVGLTYYCAKVMSGVASGELSLPTAALPGLLIAMAYPVAIWAWCLALLATATRFLSTESPVIRYLSDASYWIYLIHLPIVVALQVWVSTWSLGWQVKYPLILAIAVPLLVASYQLLVRNTWIGAWLNGRRYGRSLPSGANVAT